MVEAHNLDKLDLKNKYNSAACQQYREALKEKVENYLLEQQKLQSQNTKEQKKEKEYDILNEIYEGWSSSSSVGETITISNP